MSNKKLVIIGAGGHGRVVADIAKAMGCYESICFFDENKELTTSGGYPVFHEELNTRIKDSDVFVAIGNNKVRKDKMLLLIKEGATIPVLIHPTAVIGSNVKIKQGTVVMAGVVINCGATILEGCIINTAVSIDHDNVIGAYSHLSPGAHLAGTVMVGSMCWLGIGTIVKNNISICDQVQTGAGTVVVKDINENGCYIGVPARLMQ